MTGAQDLLHYQFHQPKQPTTLPTLVFIHGLFGDMNNLGGIARAFSEYYPILRLDLRNHGQSFRAAQMDYDLMAQDLLRLLAHLDLHDTVLIGHSMGGKTAMRAAVLQPDTVEKLIVMDIAPVNYGNHGHDEIFAGLFAVKNAAVTTRRQAEPLLVQHIPDEAIRQFMLKSFTADSPERFRFNLSALHNNYSALMCWRTGYFDKPTLFIKGGLSDYILPDYGQIISAQFPQARAFILNGCGHWVHAEKPEWVIRAIKRFLA